MKKLIMLALAGCASLPAFAADVGVSVGVYQPGVYGRVDIGNAPPPQVVYTQPAVVAPQPYATYQPQPVYLYVPDEHQRHWRRYCHQYNACGQPVYFVREQWVRDRWEHEHHRHWRDEHRRRWDR